VEGKANGNSKSHFIIELSEPFAMKFRLDWDLKLIIAARLANLAKIHAEGAERLWP